MKVAGFAAARPACDPRASGWHPSQLGGHDRGNIGPWAHHDRGRKPLQQHAEVVVVDGGRRKSDRRVRERARQRNEDHVGCARVREDHGVELGAVLELRQGLPPLVAARIARNRVKKRGSHGRQDHHVRLHANGEQQLAQRLVRPLGAVASDGRVGARDGLARCHHTQPHALLPGVGAQKAEGKLQAQRERAGRVDPVVLVRAPQVDRAALRLPDGARDASPPLRLQLALVVASGRVLAVAVRAVRPKSHTKAKPSPPLAQRGADAVHGKLGAEALLPALAGVGVPGEVLHWCCGVSPSQRWVTSTFLPSTRASAIISQK
eukprot:CAMPEP_0202115916 /NCGR_PEP_ID=MMETSP0965-20130614/39468_1 /ASSEMBLY_ACC=CAM_ASM_000507 /TAXON_ID=4773 /ORGANISM="Schizochytrium aggregatum, Strain ATCC28209" /LENGTH=319 /DNA_ID=CAMNT_0048685739 /DNA_START=234 /DNA_END=1191 /DNA_ORIENTATION=+